MRGLSLVVCVGVVVGAARAEEPQPRPPLEIAITSLLVARYNPLGLEEQLRLGLQGRLYRRSAPLFRDNFVWFGFAPKLSPVYAKYGPALEIQPLSIFNLKTTVELVDWFPAFGYLQSFPSANDDYSDSTLSRNKDAGKNYAPNGVHVMIEPLVQMKIGPIAIRNRLAFEYWSLTLHAADTTFYEPTLDTLVPNGGWVLADDLDVLWISKFRLVVGARYSVVHPFYDARNYRPGEPQRNDNGHQRLGPLVAYSFFDHGGQRFDKPSLILIVNWFVDHRWRTGADVSAGVPYVVLAFAFTSDLPL
jgi:hypothetical protein